MDHILKDRSYARTVLRGHEERLELIATATLGINTSVRQMLPTGSNTRSIATTSAPANTAEIPVKPSASNTTSVTTIDTGTDATTNNGCNADVASSITNQTLISAKDHSLEGPENENGIDQLKKALAASRAETQRMELFWRISLVDLAQAVDVCKAFQTQLRGWKETESDVRASPSEPLYVIVRLLRWSKADSVILKMRLSVAVQTSLPGRMVGVQTTPFEDVFDPVSEAAVAALSRCCVRLQDTCDSVQSQLDEVSGNFHLFDGTS